MLLHYYSRMTKGHKCSLPKQRMAETWPTVDSSCKLCLLFRSQQYLAYLGYLMYRVSSLAFVAKGGGSGHANPSEANEMLVEANGGNGTPQ